MESQRTNIVVENEQPEMKQESDQAPALKVGDCVRLKSGGPTMTVRNPDSSGKVHCVFWNHGYPGQISQFENIFFPASCLENAAWLDQRKN